MCNTQTRQFIDQVIADKVGSNTMFTLFDVTLEVKELEKSSGLPISRHSEIHDDVAKSAQRHALSVGWDRQLQSMGGNVHAFVYFNPNLHDPTTYQPLPCNTPHHSIHPSAFVPSNNNNDNNYTKDTDRWGRLRLPVSLMRKAGFRAGDVAYVAVSNDGLVVTKNNQAAIARYLVDYYGNVRLTSRTLKAGNLVGKTSFNIIVRQSEIEIC